MEKVVVSICSLNWKSVLHCMFPLSYMHASPFWKQQALHQGSLVLRTGVPCSAFHKHSCGLCRGRVFRVCFPWIISFSSKVTGWRWEAYESWLSSFCSPPLLQGMYTKTNTHHWRCCFSVFTWTTRMSFYHDWTGCSHKMPTQLGTRKGATPQLLAFHNVSNFQRFLWFAVELIFYVCLNGQS